MSDLAILKTFSSHAFLSGLSNRSLMLLASGASPFSVAAGAYLGHEGESARGLYLVQAGRVSLGIHKKDRSIALCRTAGPGEAIGWSWLVPPHNWHFDCRAEDAVHGLSLNAAWLREQCESNHELGYHFLKRYVADLTTNLLALRAQFPDLDWRFRGIE